MDHRRCERASFPLRNKGGCTSHVGAVWLAVLSMLTVIAVPDARCQDETQAIETRDLLATSTAVATTAIPPPKKRQSPEQEIAVMGMVPDGDYRLFSATVRCNAWTVGVEYDRHSWGHLLGSQMDYVAEVIPFVLLSEPAKSDFWGNPESPDQQHLYGLSLTPFGFRLLWRGNKPLKLYLSSKLGAVAFNQKALSLNASYVNFNIQAAFGVQYPLTDRIDLRVEPFEFFHVSNGYLAASNPGMDELAWQYGISYHLRRTSH